MLGRIEARLRRLRRQLSRSVWLSRLLRLPVSRGSPIRPGLVLLQIDGLSRQEFERALERGEMPFLQRLIQREHYQVLDHYSGLPSTTSAVQAEIFYGVKGAVPAFSFRDHHTGTVVRMFEPEAAARIERLHDGPESLLKGGSAYSDNYTGGADESHFCPSAMGWGPALRGANPLVLLAFVLTNLYSFLRIAVLLVLELGLALADFVRGLVRGHDFAKELKFIPTRVAIAILLRELCVIGGKIDISRGLPVVHINFLGYDEQSHRRGPSSLFAHWTLKGIDDAIARLWRAAHRSVWRHYEVWIYSDHGQVKVMPYARMQGYPIEEAVRSAFEALNGQGPKMGGESSGGVQTLRVRLLGGGLFQRLFSVLGMEVEAAGDRFSGVTGLGPVAHVYSPSRLNEEERGFAAQELVRTHRVPVVLDVQARGIVRARTERGDYRLPQDAGALFGANHPFLGSIGEDLVRLCEHPDAGDLVLLGWRDGVIPLSFAIENGTHGGVTPEETHGFALLPGDAPLGMLEHDYLRPTDLRHAAQRLLGRPAPESSVTRRRPVPTSADTLRVMTYNVHGCIGMDAKIDPERIARVIARARPDVVALQELDVGRERTFGLDQAQQIARHLEMEFHFHPAMHMEEERYGDAILTHMPQRLVKTGLLPGLPDMPQLEPRGALWVAIEVNGQEIQVINTHLGLLQRERLAQAEALLGSEWLGNELCRGPVILCGDFNSQPASPVFRRLSRRLGEAQDVARSHRPRGTFSSRFPTLRIDHIFVSPGLEVTAIDIPDWELARTASDHLPLVAEIRIPRHGESAGQ